MSRSAPRPAAGGRPASGRPADRPAGGTVRDSRGNGRETIESIVVAFTLALIFKAFEAEAFVIPTGSMAPTLMGRHKDLVCESCGTAFRVGCSHEVDEAAGRVRDGLAPTRADCPNCGLVREFDRRKIAWHDPRLDSFNGDRILVDKIAYDFREPARWDVVVFKYPEDAKTNYIKRLVGLPGETVTIAGGDLWIARDGGAPAIARKPADTLVAMLQCVSDSRQVADATAADALTPWTDWSGPDAAGGCRWTAADEGRSFAVSCPADAAATLRFRRLLPGRGAGAAGRAAAPADAVPAVIGDFQPYNASVAGPRLRSLPRPPTLVDGAHWVGDLGLEVELESQGAAGTVTLDLVEAGIEHACTLDLGAGTATLVRQGPGGGVEATAPTAVRGVGRWRVLFTNVDDELALFVDGRRVAFDRPTTWARSVADAAAALPVAAGVRPGDAEPGDLAPAGITARGAEVRVSALRVLRDVYYIAGGSTAVMAGAAPETPAEYVLEADQFFMLGDNSAASADSRFWSGGHHVDRRLIVGRALVVFWPHGVPTTWSIPLKIGTWELRLPFLPNFARMRFVR